MSFRPRQRGKDNNHTLPGSCKPLFNIIQLREKHQQKYAKHVSCTHGSDRALRRVHVHVFNHFFFKAGLISAQQQQRHAARSLPESLHYFSAAGALLRFGRGSKQTATWRRRNSARGSEDVNAYLPALMSRSSWFSWPSCCGVVMFFFTFADSHWLLTPRITPPLKGNLNEKRRITETETYPSATHTGNPPSVA